MNSYIVFFQLGEDDLTRDYVELDAYSSSEAEAYVLDDLDNQDTNIISVWEKV
jgi:hypothetical protein